MKCIRVLFLLLLAVTMASIPVNAGILDLLWGSSSDVEGASSSSSPNGGGGAERGETPPPPRNCSCVASECNCCAALDFAYVDLGGPGCVSMRYQSPTEGIALNISYGDSLLLSDAIKGSRPAPACLDLLSDLAQLCARVGQLRATADGLRWCVWLEPRLLGDAQAAYGLGCFRMGPEGMSPDAFTPEDNAVPASSTSTDAPAPAAAVTPSSPAEDVNEEEWIAAVNQSAEDGIAFFSNLLGLTFGGAQETAAGANITETPATDSATEAEAPTDAPAAAETETKK